MVIGLLGLGTVGGGVYEMLASRPDIRVKYICCLERPDNVSAIVTRDLNQILEDPEVDTVVELMGGLDPALDYVTRSLKAGRHVVTANKLLLAHHYGELRKLALEQGVSLRYTAAAGGGIGWLTALERCRRADVIHEVSGIVNGTTNYILDTMHLSPVSFQAALSRAQDFGYAEKDPSADIDGWDSMHKLVISANVAFGTCLKPEQVLVRGIRTIQRRDIDTFLAHGYCCRLLATAEHYADTYTAVVEPTLVEQKDMEAAVHSNYNLISFVSRQAGKQSFYGQGAGRYPTAYNVVQDLIDVAAMRAGGFSATGEDARVDNRSYVRQYYLRTSVSDPWLWGRTEERWETGIITCRLAASELHAWAAEATQKDPELFFAALR